MADNIQHKLTQGSVNSLASPFPPAPGSSTRPRLRAATPPARMPSSARGSSYGGYSHRSWRTSETPRSGTPTRADSERSRVEDQRRAAAQALKEERLQREAMLEERQRAQCSSAHRSASALRANTSAAVTVQAAQVQRKRQNVANEVKRSVDEMKRQREEQRAQWNAHGRAVGAAAAATRRAASSARNHLRASNLSDAQRSCAERLDMFRQSADAQGALNEGKRLMAERVRREAGLDVVRGALSRASNERSASATRLRNRSQNDLVEMELARLQATQTKQQLASRIELEASPDRVRELKGVEARRKAGLTGALRDQYRAFEALSLERRKDEDAMRQRMHDAVMCSRYGLLAHNDPPPSRGVDATEAAQ